MTAKRKYLGRPPHKPHPQNLALHGNYMNKEELNAQHSLLITSMRVAPAGSLFSLTHKTPAHLVRLNIAQTLITYSNEVLLLPWKLYQVSAKNLDHVY